MRYCYITGVSRGLGRALAETLANDATRIVGFGRSRGEFEGAFHSCDFTKPQLAASIFADALAADSFENATDIVFINNTGALGPLDFAQNLDPFDIERTLSANLCGAAMAVTRFLHRTQNIDLPKLFVQISSGAALPERAKPSWSLYCASKAGQEQLVRSIALEQARVAFPCRLISINPGVMETAMQEAIRATSPEAFPDVQRFLQLKEEGKVADPVDVALRIRDLIADIPSLENGRTYDLTTHR